MFFQEPHRGLYLPLPTRVEIADEPEEVVALELEDGLKKVIGKTMGQKDFCKVFDEKGRFLTLWVVVVYDWNSILTLVPQIPVLLALFCAATSVGEDPAAMRFVHFQLNLISEIFVKEVIFPNILNPYNLS